MDVHLPRLNRPGRDQRRFGQTKRGSFEPPAARLSASDVCISFAPPGILLLGFPVIGESSGGATALSNTTENPRPNPVFPTRSFFDPTWYQMLTATNGRLVILSPARIRVRCESRPAKSWGYRDLRLQRRDDPSESCDVCDPGMKALGRSRTAVQACAA